jgi:N-acetylglucosaminyltransferase
MVTKITVLQILLTPVTMGMALAYLIFSRLELTLHSLGLALIWLLLGRGVRGYSHLRRHPQEILLLPVTALVVIFIALPIKLYAFVTMNKQGWLTRTADSVGGEGQGSATLTATRTTAPAADTTEEPVAVLAGQGVSA